MTTHLSLRTAVTAVTLLTLGAGALRAQSTIDTTFAVRANAKLSIQNMMNGSVIVRPWNRSQLRVQAEYERARVDFQVQGNQVSVRTENRRGSSSVDYIISAPAGTAIEVVNGLNVDVTVTGVCGPVSITTVSGDIEVQCIDGEGAIQSVSGDISVADARGPLEINATSGDVELRGARAPVSIHNVSGDVTLSEITTAEVDVETVNGDVEYSGRILDNGRYRFAAHSGDVTVHVAGNPNATFSVSTFSGDFDSEFPIQVQRVSKDWEFRLGNGSARVRLNSFSGTISLRRGLGASREE